MRTPHTNLSPATLRAIVQEFVTRDGTDHSSVERRVENVLRQLEAGRAEQHFDGQTETCLKAARLWKTRAGYDIVLGEFIRFGAG